MGTNVNTNLHNNLNYTLANLQFRYPANSVATPYFIDMSGITRAQNNNNAVPAANSTRAAARSARAHGVELDDGKISFGKKVGNFLKGVGNFFKGMVCDENGKFSLGQTLKTVAIGAAIAAAAILIPGAGAVIAGAFLLSGAIHTGKGIVAACKAETDEEAAQAWQNIGSGVTETALAAVGCKKTGAFGKARSAAKSVKASAKSMKSAYDTAGLEGLKREAKTQYTGAKTSIKNNVIEPTKQNWKNLTDKDARYESRKASYGENESAYHEGYGNLRDASYNDSASLVDYYKTQMNIAKRRASAKGATKTDRAAYREAKARYEGAKTTFETRVKAGEFKGTAPIEEAEIQARYQALENARKAYDGSDAAKTALADAQANYYRAIAQKTANEGPSKFGEYSFRAKASIQDGWRQPNVKLLTVTAAGRGYQEPAYAYAY